MPPAKEAPRIEEAEDLGALALFQLYADTVEMSPEARSKGLSILEVGSPVTTEGQPTWACDASHCTTSAARLLCTSFTGGTFTRSCKSGPCLPEARIIL